MCRQSTLPEACALSDLDSILLDYVIDYTETSASQVERRSEGGWSFERAASRQRMKSSGKVPWFVSAGRKHS